jgi:hypothetical protein
MFMDNDDAKREGIILKCIFVENFKVDKYLTCTCNWGAFTLQNFLWGEQNAKIEF